jgi:membrane protease YdiL (CAAX protease family)
MNTYGDRLSQQAAPARAEHTAKAASEPQHTLLESAFLHLGPGILIALFYVVTAPAIARRGFPPIAALLLAIVCVALPIELGELVRQGHRRNGRYSLSGIVSYRQPLGWWEYPLIVMAFLLLALLISGAAGAIDTALTNRLVQFLPAWFFLNDFGQYAGYSRNVLLVTFAANLIVNGLAAPIAEELYFRGYLLPRLSRFGALAPLINAALFAIYHFWQPYVYASVLAVIVPFVYLIWWKRNIWLAIAIHCALNLIGNSLFFVGLLSHAR